MLTSACYVLLLPAHVIFYRYGMRTMLAHWIEYVRFVHCMQKAVLVFLVRRKVGKIIVIILLAVLLKGTILLETAIDYLPHCEVLERFVPVLANQLDGLAAVRYWGRKISTVIVPFFILIYCNCRIVMELRNKQKEMQQKSIKKRSAKSDVTSS
ncbi:unnamed protein product [Heligmosomoides polygyrus]|uniref:G_PROTEIN_RECEP_F1_2 domain-containing protein n=1 Tax=Heligmosomoides polygyrus TaxID=6339 RepID=A0A183FYA6_HELPZ|nr:unnamed protein product [Heligmosomoides polygyrus]